HHLRRAGGEKVRAQPKPSARRSQRKRGPRAFPDWRPRWMGASRAGPAWASLDKWPGSRRSHERPRWCEGASRAVLVWACRSLWPGRGRPRDCHRAGRIPRSRSSPPLLAERNHIVGGEVKFFGSHDPISEWVDDLETAEIIDRIGTPARFA